MVIEPPFDFIRIGEFVDAVVEMGLYRAEDFGDPATWGDWGMILFSDGLAVPFEIAKDDP